MCLAAMALAVCCAWLPRPAAAAVGLPTDFMNEVLVSQLNTPTSLAFLPDGRALFTEQKTGYVRMVVNGHLAATDPEFVVPSVNTDGYERGLEGIAVDPGWPQRPYVYFHYTRLGGYFRIVRYTVTGDVADPLGETLSFGAPLLLIDDITDSNPNHNAGCLRFGPDSCLYASLGEDENWCAAADSTTLKGCILRMNVMDLPSVGGPEVPRALLIPPDNPLSTSDSNAMLVWAYGLRNPWRFQIDSVTGLLYASDVGEASFEEMNEVAPGDYLGWPWREGNMIVDRSSTCPEPGGSGSIAYKVPIVAMGRGTQLTAIISAGMYRPIVGAPANWPPAYNGNVFYGEYYSGFLKRLKFVGGSWQTPAPDPGQTDPNTWATGLISSVDYLVGPDGSLWWLRQYDDSMDGVTGSLQRIRYVGQTLHVTGPDSDLALSARPNPSRDATRLAFRLPAAGYVRLEVFDLGGRVVRRLVDATLPAGPHQFVWNGRDRDGHAAPPGLYLARLERPDRVEATHIVRVH